MNKIFKDNFDALAKFNPVLAQFLEQRYSQVLEKPPYAIEFDQGKDITLKIDGRQLTSHHSRKRQAQFAISRTDPALNLYIYGFGLGDELREAIARQQENTVITVILLNPDLFYYLLMVDDELKDVFIAGRVNIVIADNETAVHTNRVIIYPELYLNSRFANKLKTRLIILLDEDWGQQVFENTIGKKSDNIIKSNIPYFESESPLTLDEFIHHDRFLILGAGPSLQNQCYLIREYKDRDFKIVAVDTSLKFLEPLNIIPDYVFSIDIYVGDNHAGKDFFLDFSSYKDSVLIFGPASSPSLFLNFPGKRYYLINDRALKVNPKLDRNYANILNMSGSVLLSATSFAIGCRPSEIAFLGADFAYLDNQSHAGSEGVSAFTTGDSKISVLCNDGTMQRSQRNFVLYREYLEQMIAEHPEIRFINLSETGAIIKGTVSR